MKTVNINGVRHACPFAATFRDLTADERAGLLESGRQIGFYHPTITYDSPTHGPAVADGVNRAELADEHGIPLPVQHLGAVSDEDAERIAKRVNADRRHLTADEQRAARAARIERVAEARAEGKSLRSIAADEGVSVGQVQRDLSDAAMSGVSGDTPETILGRDGKEYPAAAPPAVEQISSAHQVTPEPADSDDELPDYSTAEPGYESDPETGPEPSADDGGQVPPAEPGAPPAGLNPTDHTRGPAKPRKEYPEPVAGLLKDFTALATKLGKFVNSPEGEKFTHYVGQLVKSGTIAQPGWIRHRDAFINGRKYRRSWTGFAGVRYLLKLATQDRTCQFSTLKRGFQEAVDADGGDE